MGFIETISTLAFDFIDEILWHVVGNAESAYSAGYSRASTIMGADLSRETLLGKVAEFMQQYEYKVVQQGMITVSSPRYDIEGSIIGYIDTDIPWMKDKPFEIRNDIIDIIESGMTTGKPAGYRRLADGTYPEGTIARDIQDLVSGYKSDAATISRTETARSYFRGEKDRYEESGVEYVQWLAADDCCEMCEPYAGEIMDLSECPGIPLHPNCRCDIRPVLGSELEEYLKNRL